jgi:hypothetical protein
VDDVSDSHFSPARPEHTPGPWRVIEVGGFWVVPGVVTFAHGTPDITIIPVPLDSEANANLIAAAPDLLQLLETAVRSEHSEIYMAWDPDQRPEWCKEAEKLLVRLGVVP